MQQEINVQKYDPLINRDPGHQEYIEKRTDTKDLLMNVYKLLAAVEWDKQKKQWVKATNREPLAPMNFINKVMTVLYSLVNSNTMRANLKEEDVHRITYLVMEEFVLTLYASGCKEGVPEENYGFITTLIETEVFLTLTRAKDDKEREHESELGKSKQRQTTSIPQPVANAEGWRM